MISDALFLTIDLMDHYLQDPTYQHIYVIVRNQMEALRAELDTPPASGDAHVDSTVHAPPGGSFDGMWIGVNDRHGRRIHLGDTLRFDPQEWGGHIDCEFVIALQEGEIVHPGSPGDLTQWCEVSACPHE